MSAVYLGMFLFFVTFAAGYLCGTIMAGKSGRGKSGERHGGPG